MADKKNKTLIFVGIAALAAFLFFRKKGKKSDVLGESKAEENKDAAGGGGGAGTTSVGTSPVIEKMATVPVTINTSTTTSPAMPTSSSRLPAYPSSSSAISRISIPNISRTTPIAAPAITSNPSARRAIRFSGFMNMDAESGDMLENL